MGSAKLGKQKVKKKKKIKYKLYGCGNTYTILNEQKD